MKAPTPSPTRLIAVLALGATACYAPHGSENVTRLGGGVSVFPNVGTFTSISTKVDGDHLREWHLEARFHYQWWDAGEFFDDGRPLEDDYQQVDGSILWRTSPAASRHLLVRVGVIWANFGDNPTRETGRYYGAIIGLGVERDISPSVSIGPEISMAPMYNFEESDFVWSPQLTWGLRVRL